MFAWLALSLFHSLQGRQIRKLEKWLREIPWNSHIGPNFGLPIFLSSNLGLTCLKFNFPRPTRKKRQKYVSGSLLCQRREGERVAYLQTDILNFMSPQKYHAMSKQVKTKWSALYVLCCSRMFLSWYKNQSCMSGIHATLCRGRVDLKLLATKTGCCRA